MAAASARAVMPGSARPRGVADIRRISAVSVGARDAVIARFTRLTIPAGIRKGSAVSARSAVLAVRVRTPGPAGLTPGWPGASPLLKLPHPPSPPGWSTGLAPPMPK